MAADLLSGITLLVAKYVFVPVSNDSKKAIPSATADEAEKR